MPTRASLPCELDILGAVKPDVGAKYGEPAREICPRGHLTGAKMSNPYVGILLAPMSSPHGRFARVDILAPQISSPHGRFARVDISLAPRRSLARTGDLPAWTFYLAPSPGAQVVQPVRHICPPGCPIRARGP